MSRQSTVSMPTPHIIAHMGCITLWLLAHGCIALVRVIATPCSCLKPAPLPIAVMAPCHIPLPLGTTTSHGIAPMTPHLCTRHCTLVHSMLCHVLSKLCCCCILMSHPSNIPWYYVHGSSSCLAQAIAPLCHYQMGSLSRLVPLRPWVSHHHMLWSSCVGANKACPMCVAHIWGLALRPLGVATPMPPCLTLSHLPPPLLKSISGHFRSFWMRHHRYLRRNNRFIK